MRQNHIRGARAGGAGLQPAIGDELRGDVLAVDQHATELAANGRHVVRNAVLDRLANHQLAQCLAALPRERLREKWEL